jgi:hypothetical protein
VETASGVDGDDDECVETLRLTGRDGNQCNPIFQFNVFVVTKYTTFILLFRCHPGIDFDIREREVSFSGILSFGLPLLPPSFSPQSSVSIKLSVTDCGNDTIG